MQFNYSDGMLLFLLPKSLKQTKDFSAISGVSWIQTCGSSSLDISVWHVVGDSVMQYTCTQYNKTQQLSFSGQWLSR